MRIQQANLHRQIGVVLAIGLILATALVSPASARPLAAGGDAGVRLLYSDGQGIALEIQTPDFAVQDTPAQGSTLSPLETGMTCQRISVPDYTTSTEPGRPQLPVKVVLLGVPADARLERRGDSAPDDSGRRAADHLPAPENKIETDQDGRAPVVTQVAARPDPEVYSADSLYPAQTVRLVDLGFMRSQRIVRLEITPFQVNPVSKLLQVHKLMRVVVRFQGEARAAAAASAVEPADFEAGLKSTLVNYEAAKTWRGTPATIAATPTPWLPPSPAYKILVKTAGFYQVNRAALAAAGRTGGHGRPAHLPPAEYGTRNRNPRNRRGRCTS